MTGGPRAAPRGTPSGDPPTPKSRSKVKSGRVRSSPSQNKSSATFSASANATQTPAAAAAAAAQAAAAAAAAAPTQSVSQHALQQAGFTRSVYPGSVVPSAKRARSSGGNVKEPDAKRAKPITGAAAAAVAAAAIRQAKPGSPTTSSRSRQRRAGRARAAGGEEAATGSHVLAAATSATTSQRAHPQQRGRGMTARMPPPSQLVSCFSVDGCSFSSNVKSISLNKRVFGHEIQCLMHAFGEVRYCARDVLEQMEDTVRGIVCRVAIQAHGYAVEEAAHKIQAANIGTSQELGTARSEKFDETVRIRHVAQCLRRDSRALQRLNQSLKHSAELHHDKLPQDPMERTFLHAPKPWEFIAELGNLATDGSAAIAAEKFYSNNDVMSLCSWKALHAFRTAMGSQQFQDFATCRGVTLVRQTSRSRAPNILDQPRIVLFREWLNLPEKSGLRLPDETLFALGHVAWEAVGLITQTALLHRYFDDLAKGYGDPKASCWSYGRHLVSALSYGLGTAILVPLTDVQAVILRQEIDAYLLAMQGGSQRWRGYSKASSRCLLPHHLREALRRLEKSEDGMWNSRDQSFLQSSGLL